MKKYSISSDNIRCTKPLSDGNCIQPFEPFNGIICQSQNLFPLGKVTPSITHLNGSTTQELCIGEEVVKSKYNCGDKIVKNDSVCPWIGYNLFSGGDGGKGVDGTYTYHTDETNPYWCFNESDGPNPPKPKAIIIITISTNPPNCFQPKFFIFLIIAL